MAHQQFVTLPTTLSNEQFIRAAYLWHKFKLDTIDIAKALDVRECAVYNQLDLIRGTGATTIDAIEKSSER